MKQNLQYDFNYNIKKRYTRKLSEFFCTKFSNMSPIFE
ncbi:hypothetical protein pb186bvf_013665 [Paramecium bursaria]